MQQSQIQEGRRMQLQSDPTHERLLKMSALIQNGSQFLTYVKRNILQDDLKRFDKDKTLTSYLQNLGNGSSRPRINQDSLIQLFIQIAYFIFSCRRFNLKPDLNPQTNIIVVQSQVQKKFTLLMFYRLAQDSTFANFESIEMINVIYKHIFQQYSLYLSLLDGVMNPLDEEVKKIIVVFQKQFEYLLKKPQAYEPNKEKQFFLCLEETTLFREYSVLLKIKNCSVLDLIKTSEVFFTKFKECKQNQKNLMKSQLNAKTNDPKQNQDYDTNKKKEKQLQDNYSKFFKLISHRENQMIEEQAILKVDKQQSDKMKISFKLRQKSYSNFYQAAKKILPGLMEIESQMDFQKRAQQPQTEYIIEYSNDRNSICVRLMTNRINLHVQNTDFLMYQSSILAFDAVNVNIQVLDAVDQTNKEKRMIKKLAFKGTSCLNSKQYPFQKILLLLDATMIASKICEPQLNFNKANYYCTTPDHQRLAVISKRINHYTKIFLKCAEKVYSE